MNIRAEKQSIRHVVLASFLVRTDVSGIAAVDLYENRLGRVDKALDVLITLHRSGLSTLPVRERLARSAARSG